MGKGIKKHAVWLFRLLLAICILTGCAGVGTGGDGAGAVQDSRAVGQQLEEVFQAEEELTEEIDERYAVSAAEPGTETAGRTKADEESDAETAPDAAPDTEMDLGSEASSVQETESLSVQEDGHYTSKEQVALYLHIFGHLPDNYITKKEAEELGWDSRQGNLDEAAPGMSIGGSRFGNYEGLLPEEKGRKYYECDIDYEGGYRGPKRLIYSNDGLVFYTEDHYKTFEQLY